jgi:hypothetical protein
VLYEGPGLSDRCDSTAQPFDWHTQCLCYNVVEDFNNGGKAVSTMNFSVPEKVKEEFNACFAGENKSAIVTRLLQEAIEARSVQEQRSKAIDAIFELRKTAPVITDAEIYQIRQEFRE